MAPGAPQLSAGWYWQALCLVTALACGLLVGIERGFDLRSLETGTRVAGVRTFTLLGLSSGLAGLIGHWGQDLTAGALIFGGAAILAIGFAHRPGLSEKPDATTPVAALATIALSFVAGFGEPRLAIAGATIVVLLLASKAELHGFLDKLDEQDVKSLARYAVIAGAVFPFLPNGQYGPLHAWNPQRLWLVVVLITGFSFLSYVANRIFGERHGTIATALIGGAYSSTAVTQSLAQRLGTEEDGQGAQSAGIAIASAVMYPRVALLVAALVPRIFFDFTLLTLPAFLVAVLAAWELYRRAPRSEKSAAPGNPIALVPALGFLLFVAIAAVAAKWASGRFGQNGIAGLLLFTGTMDVDTAIITLSGLDPKAISAPLAALALVGTVLANMAVKLGIILVYARSKGKAAVLALASSMAALAAMIVVGWLRL